MQGGNVYNKDIYLVASVGNLYLRQHVHEFHAKKLTAQIYPPSVITYIVKAHLPH
jgi:hypothetical protein